MGLRTLLLACVPALGCQAAELPFPVLFLHGLTGGQQTFDGCLTELQQTFDVPPTVVFHVCLNHDADPGRAALDSTDMVPIGFTACGSTTVIQPDPSTRLFALNLNDDEFADVGGHPDHNGSNQSAITKQGLALSWAIAEVQQITGSEQVILVGHSMGGLAIREYLQRTDGSGEPRWWLDSQDPQGHAAIRVVTTGCPHLGSNSLRGDGSVLIDRQWLYDGNGQPLPAGAADTLLTADRHTDADLFGCPRCASAAAR